MSHFNRGDRVSSIPDSLQEIGQGDYTLAEEHFGKALELNPDHPDVLFLAAILERTRGNIAESVAYLRRGTEADPTNLKIHYALTRELERQDDVAHAEEIIRTLEYLHELAPENQVVLLELLRMAAKVQDEAIAWQYINKLSDLSADWQSENRDQLETVYDVLEEDNFSELILELSFLRNMLHSQPVFQDDLQQVQLPPTDLGYLIPEFINIPQPEVEVPDGSGGWSVLHDDYGMPVGKIKTILLDLEDAFPDPDDQRVRLTTTAEIYWDGIFHAEKRDDSLMTETKLDTEKMELRYRGFSEWSQADSVSPKLPDYSHVSGTNQRWRDLEGFYTRFGDVSELLEEIDDRYVIMNAGDEIALKFRALHAPREGYTRSYVLVADGWVKDGDYNTEASATVEPLPYHGQSDYEYSPTGDLQNDPVFQEHTEDWIHYHTRYITPHSFRSAFQFDE